MVLVPICVSLLGQGNGTRRPVPCERQRAGPISTPQPLQGPLRSLLYIHPNALGARRQKHTFLRSRAGAGDGDSKAIGGVWRGEESSERGAGDGTSGRPATTQLSLAGFSGAGRSTSGSSQYGASLSTAISRQEDARSAPSVPSRELAELVKVQLDMLVSILESQISEEFNGVAGSDYTLGVRCAMYCRTASLSAMSALSPTPAASMSSTQTPASTADSNLRLQLVAASGGFVGERFAFEDDEVFSSSSSSSVITASAEMEDTWLANQTMIALPDNGGLMLPLTHKNFLVGLLLVERVAKEVGFGGNVGSPIETPSDVSGRSNSSVWIPPVQDVFGPAEMGIIKQSAQALSMSCAIELKGILDAAQNKMQQERLQGLLNKARKPLTTLKTLGRMLQPRLAPGEPERDMTDGVVAQGQYLGDLIEQIQKAVNSSGTSGSGGSRGVGGPGDERGSGRMARLPSANGALRRGGTKNGNVAKPAYKYALPSSCIGSDNTVTWDLVSTGEDEGDEDHSQDEPGGAQPVTDSTVLASPALEGPTFSPPPSSTDVAEILRPLLDSALAFCAIKGVTLVVEGDVMNETAPCLIQGDYAFVKHVLGTLLEAAVELANSEKDRGSRVLCRVTKEKARGNPYIVFEVAVSIMDIEEKQTTYLDVGAHLGIEQDVYMDDVAGLNGQVQLRSDSIALFLPEVPPAL